MSYSPQKLDDAKRKFDSSRKGTLWTPRNKILAVLALLYLFCPIDLLPDWLFPLVGWLDDIGVLGAVFLWITSHRGNPEP